MLPGSACIGGLVDSVALHDVAAKFGFAHPDIDHVGVGFRYRYRAHRRALDLAIGDGPPDQAAVRGLPQSAAGGAEIVFHGAAGAASGSDRAPTPRWANTAPLQRAE